MAAIPTSDNSHFSIHTKTFRRWTMNATARRFNSKLILILWVCGTSLRLPLRSTYVCEMIKKGSDRYSVLLTSRLIFMPQRHYSLSNLMYHYEVVIPRKFMAIKAACKLLFYDENNSDSRVKLLTRDLLLLQTLNLLFRESTLSRSFLFRFFPWSFQGCRNCGGVKCWTEFSQRVRIFKEFPSRHYMNESKH